MGVNGRAGAGVGLRAAGVVVGVVVDVGLGLAIRVAPAGGVAAEGDPRVVAVAIKGEGKRSDEESLKHGDQVVYSGVRW